MMHTFIPSLNLQHARVIDQGLGERVSQGA